MEGSRTLGKRDSKFEESIGELEPGGKDKMLRFQRGALL